MNTGTACALAVCIRALAHSRTWLMLPAAEASPSMWIDWIESTTARPGRICSMCSRICSRLFSART